MYYKCHKRNKLGEIIGRDCPTGVVGEGFRVWKERCTSGGKWQEASPTGQSSTVRTWRLQKQLVFRVTELSSFLSTCIYHLKQYSKGSMRRLGRKRRLVIDL